MDHIINIARDIYHLFEMHVLLRLQHIGLRDILDILILAFVFFLLFKFIINRRAAKLALGLVFIVGIMFVSRYFDMKAMSFIFQNFTQTGLIAIIIMFQPELRSVLEKIGNASITNVRHISNDTKNTSYVNTAISILTETACDLSLEKTGALIVIERETKLGDHIKTGTVINAQISSQLLKNIFYNKAPLHDGAVILRNYRVFSAGCFLPLSLKEDIDENMGTRHRAAIGISEVSDAVVIVVSEETGKISIVHDGKLKQNYSYKSLQKELTELLLPSSNEKSTKKTRFGRKFLKKGDDN